MSGWTAVLPIKPAAERKTRLADVLSPDERVRLTDYMLHMALDALSRVRPLVEVTTLSVEPLGVRRFHDFGRGLNEELRDVARAVPGRLLILNPDLPAVTTAEIEDFLASADNSGAIAPDRHRRGTNALALASADPARLAFGLDSFATHRTLLPGAAILEQRGFAFDIDTSDDLAEARRQGLLPPNL